MLSVIIVSWNVRALLDGCLESLRPLLNHESDSASAPAEIIVVDNASRDGTVAWLRTAWPQVQVLASAKNLGFGRANNAGLARARGEWLLLLNPDTLVQPGAVETLITFLAAHPAAGMAAPRLLYGDGKPSGRWPAQLRRKIFARGMNSAERKMHDLHARIPNWTISSSSSSGASL